jgi:hypothetical protein
VVRNFETNVIVSALEGDATISSSLLHQDDAKRIVPGLHPQVGTAGNQIHSFIDRNRDVFVLDSLQPTVGHLERPASPI